MNLSQKLDFLQEVTMKHTDEPNKLYLTGLLAEHAEEEDVTDAFLIWFDTLLCV